MIDRVEKAMKTLGRHAAIKVLFVAGFGPIAQSPKISHKLYQEVLGLPLEGNNGDDGYRFSAFIPGVKHFAVWPLAQASVSCFGKRKWPKEIPVPQAWLEFDVEDIESATAILESAGHRLLTRQKLEPWGQTVTRFLSPEGILMALTHSPELRAKH